MEEDQVEDNTMEPTLNKTIQEKDFITTKERTTREAEEKEETLTSRM